MGNTNFQTIFQMQSIVNSVVKQATGREAVQNIDMDYVTVAQQKKTEETTTDYAGMASFVNNNELPLKVLAKVTAVRSGTGTPAPDNLRPITGWTGVTVTRTGTNLFDKSNAIHGHFINSNDVSATNATYAHSDYIPVKPGCTYYCSADWYTGINVITYYDSEKTKITAGANSTHLYTTPDNCYYVRFNMLDNKVDTSFFNYPSTDTQYHAYSGDTYTFTFPEATGTVYSAVLNVNSGVLTIDKLCKKVSDFTWAYQEANTRFKSTAVSDAETKQYTSAKLVSSFCVAGTGAISSPSDSGIGIYTDKCIYLRFTDQPDTVEELLSDYGDQQIMYTLATPITVQLTPTEIDSLIGENNVYADTGDVSVSYTTYYPII